ncbi:MAG TPA: pirin family protein [Burkholderiales bacterium]|nr:pirin family protein [Burkholderiales bacterium]
MDTTQATQTADSSRMVESIVMGKQTSDGAGVKLTRVLTHSLQKRLDPFLMLDVFRSDNPANWIGGFPDHPHRGFETMTYMIEGRMRHRDNAGHEGLIENGGVQWMVAGRGIIHSEMPEQQKGLMQGFQLWINLPSKDKLCEPWYKDIQSNQLPEFSLENGIIIRIIAGSILDKKGAVQRGVTHPLILDLHLPTGSIFSHSIPGGYNAFSFVYQGEILAGSDKRRILSDQMVIWNTPQSDAEIVIEASQNSRVLLIAGSPLNEPIVQYGPFVMNTQQEIFQAMEDFKAGNFTNKPKS